MKTLLFLLEKEFRQIFRNSSIIRIIFVMPIIQLIVLPIAADYEVKNVNIAVVDHDQSSYSRQLVQKIIGSGYFRLVENTDSYKKALKSVEQNDSDVIIEIPAHFERTLIKENEAQLLLAINAVNGTKGNMGGAYLNSIIKDFNQDVRTDWVTFPRMNPMPLLDIVPRFWYNTRMNYQLFMVPGILVILVTMVGSFLTALNIVKEKEAGTIEQINVTPIKKHHFILGKLIPFWVLGLVVTAIGLTVSRVVFGIVPVGSLLVIFGFTAIFLLAVLGLGLLMSNFSDTQQQAMFFAFFMIMVFVLMGGLYTSIDGMPNWAKIMTKFNPVAYFIDVMRMVVIKGSGLYEIRTHIFAILSFAIVFNGLAIWTYKKQV
ncbi:ABC transporter permease [Flectobacillus roseus]